MKMRKAQDYYARTLDKKKCEETFQVEFKKLGYTHGDIHQVVCVLDTTLCNEEYF